MTGAKANLIYSRAAAGGSIGSFIADPIGDFPENLQQIKGDGLVLSMREIDAGFGGDEVRLICVELKHNGKVVEHAYFDRFSWFLGWRLRRWKKKALKRQLAIERFRQLECGPVLVRHPHVNRPSGGND